MDTTEISTAVVTALQDIAPEVAQEDLAADSPLREQVDLDSMDWLNFLVRLHTKFGVDIPEADYRQLVTLRDVTEYLATRMAGR
ncbi:acyl carrier protein [Rhodococcus sp. T7]|uniref:acyl carrier protein n=1 Tax=Rhodococcus sp. T7 TaxID=627444 RepID=UPI00135AE027|nr:acyl carrier protein [Rhodococcus sp. T7]KAF0958751.1 Acyl carrier protein [Rhodococcus sp. T7]